MSDDNADAETVASQGGISLLGTLLSRLLQFLFLAMVTRLVAPSLFGIFTLGLAIVMFIQEASSLGTPMSIDYFLPKYIKSNNMEKAKGTLVHVLMIGILSSSVAALLLVFLNNSIAAIIGDEEISRVLPIFAIIIPFRTLNRILATLFNGLKGIQYRVYSRELVFPISKIMLTYIFLALGLGVLGLVFGHIISLVISSVVAVGFLLSKYEWVRESSNRSTDVTKLISYSVPLMMGGLVFSATNWVDRFLIGYYMEAADIAFYHVGFALANSLLLFLRAVNAIFKPVIAESPDNRVRLRSTYQLVTRWVIMMTLPAAITLLVAPGTFLALFFTPEYRVAKFALLILIVGYLVSVLLGPEGRLLRGLGYSRLVLYSNLLLLMTNILLDIFLIPRFGIVGAAIGTTGGVIISNMFGLSAVYYTHQIHPYTLDTFRLIGAAVPALLVGTMLVRSIADEIILGVVLPPVVLISYLICVFLFRGFTKDDERVAKQFDDSFGIVFLQRFIRT